MCVSFVPAATEPSGAVLIAPFSASSLAGTAGCQLLLRPGGAALFCFRCAALRGFWFPPKKIGPAEQHLFRLLQKMQTLAWGAGATCLSVPREKQSSWKNGKGEYDSRTEWHRCTAWGKLAEFAGKLEKGAHVQIEGELRYREYKKDRGSDASAAPVKRRLAEIHASRILKLDRTAKQDEPAPDGDASDFPVDQPAA